MKRECFNKWKRLFAPQRGGLGKKIGYSPHSGANNRSSCAIRPAAGRTREAVVLYAPQLGNMSWQYLYRSTGLKSCLTT